MTLKQIADAIGQVEGPARGKAFADAVRKALADRQLMKRWNVEVPKGAGTVEPEVAESVEEQAS